MWYEDTVYVCAALVIILVLFKLYQKWSCGMCKSDVKLTGKVFIVTGANRGIGFETAKDLARREARVILACRDEQRGTEARDKIIRETGTSSVAYKHLDLASLKSIKAFAHDVLSTEHRLDVLINNAGGMSFGNRKTQDGILVDMQINHFGPFLLTNLLLPILKRSAPSRVVTVSSAVHHFGRVNLDTINVEGYYLDILLYFNTKLCNVLFGDELSRRLKGSGVTSNSLHPGAVHTEVWKNTNCIARANTTLWNRMFFKNAWEGAQTSIHCAVSPDCEGVSGKYYSDCRVAWKSWRARDTDLAGKLWKYSEMIVGLSDQIDDLTL